jgi:hypothetical protein
MAACSAPVSGTDVRLTDGSTGLCPSVRYILDLKLRLCLARLTYPGIKALKPTGSSDDTLIFPDLTQNGLQAVFIDRLHDLEVVWSLRQTGQPGTKC